MSTVCVCELGSHKRWLSASDLRLMFEQTLTNFRVIFVLLLLVSASLAQVRSYPTMHSQIMAKPKLSIFVVCFWVGSLFLVDFPCVGLCVFGFLFDRK